MTTPRISAVMPCLNEERTLPICIQKAQQAFAKLGVIGEVVIGDNGSTDRSVEIAESLGAKVAHQPIKGYGAALSKAIETAQGEIIIMGDSDDSYDWRNLKPFVDKIDEGFDLVMGNRFAGGIEPGAMPFLHKYLGNPVLSFISRIVYRAPIRDFHCGMRAFTKRASYEMRLRTTGMEFATEMVANSCLQGLKITEVPIKLYPDGRNRPPHLRSFRDGWRHLCFIFTYAPDYLYIYPSILMTFLGFALLAILINGPVIIFGQYFGIHFLALGSLLAIVGMNTFSFGVIAKLLLSRQLQHIKSKLVDIARKKFSLEKGLIYSGILGSIGMAANISLLFHWIKIGGSMESSIHLSFAAQTFIAMGASGIFSSFIINMLAKD